MQHEVIKALVSAYFTPGALLSILPVLPHLIFLPRQERGALVCPFYGWEN